ncbi:MAG TPA: hypothetical protein VG899_12475 [Mycobacteriales bacterium]|nr:hypothetical protein [Mycobacteriales bacterium]
MIAALTKLLVREEPVIAVKAATVLTNVAFNAATHYGLHLDAQTQTWVSSSALAVTSAAAAWLLRHLVTPASRNPRRRHA